MIPQGGSNVEAVVQLQQPSKTYGIDFSTGKMLGKVDGLAAVEQAVFKILNTERFVFAIYSPNYGAESGTVGRSPATLQSNISKEIRTALLRDDRILDVQDILVTVTGDEAVANFTVISIFGSYQQEVNSFV